jgi:branched-chain amino acid transport system substrate-binding protein
MKEMPTDDPLFGKGSIRADGRTFHDMFCSRSRRRKESRQRYDYYKLLSTVPGDKAYHPLSAKRVPAG